MKNQWKKLGFIYNASGEKDWLASHAALPIAEHIGGDLFKIYFSSRDRMNRSFTGYIVIDINNPDKIIDISERPILVPGSLGEFDDSGAMASWLVRHEYKRFIYYIGWNVGGTVPFRNSIGLAISENKGKFCRYANGPIVDRSLLEPHFVASCCVIPDKKLWRMWYLSCTEWVVKNGKAAHRYHIKYAESKDGVFWNRQGIVAIDYINKNEYAISRPSVVRDKDSWKMWFSCRGDSYRIGYAESVDGVKWKRLDSDCGIGVSESGWDSEMIEYPFVFDHKDRRYMLYNGNGYGRTGFGLAVLD